MQSRYPLVLFYIICSLSITLSPALGTKHLSRYCESLDDDSSDEESQIESCRYYLDSKTTISYNGDKVYDSKEYKALSKRIEDEREFIKNLAEQDKASNNNFLSVILSATGTNKKNVTKQRVFDHLYAGVSDEESNSKSGKKVSCITASKNQNNQIMILVNGNWRQENGESQDINGPKLQKNIPDKIKANEDLHTFGNELNKRLILSKGEFEEGLIPEVPSCRSSHTEPLCIAVLKKLDKNVFQKEFLSKGHELDYYEIHMISYYDACESCNKYLYGQMDELKAHFGNNLFLFFHSCLPYIKYDNFNREYPTNIYTIKFKKDKNNLQSIQAGFNKKKELVTADALPTAFKNNRLLDKRKSINLARIPTYYFGIISSLTDKNINISIKAQRNSI